MATTKKPKAVIGVFANRTDAEHAIEELHRAGFRDSQVGVIYRDKGKTVRKKVKNDDETLAEEVAAAGAVAGVGIGALVGLGVVAGVVPVIGPAIAAGTLGVVLSNAAAGAAIAGLAGVLIGLGIPEEEAEWYEREVKAGRTVVTVKATSRQEEAREILRRHNGYDQSYAAAAGSDGRKTSRVRATGEDRTIRLHEEEMQTHKQPVKAGEVRVRKEVVTEQKTIDVPVTREEVVVERRPVSSRRASASSIRPGEEIRIPVREEKVRVEKTPVVREEVRVGKRTVTDTERVSGIVRRERARVEKEGKVDVRETGSRTRVSTRNR